jgi:hypothetical protein
MRIVREVIMRMNKTSQREWRRLEHNHPSRQDRRRCRMNFRESFFITMDETRSPACE